MLSDGEARRRLAAGSAAVIAADPAGLAAAQDWLTGLALAELLRVDAVARRSPWEGAALGRAEQWTDEVLAGRAGVAAAALASMHPDGHVRERAVDVLAALAGELSDRALALRLTDHVGVVRLSAARAVLRRRGLASAGAILPILEVARERARMGSLRERYVHALTEEHGAPQVWAAMRESRDRRLRREAFRHSLDAGLLSTEDAASALTGEPDQVVRGLLGRAVADRATPEMISEVLLTRGTAEGRALGLVRLSATEIPPAQLRRLLVDTSMLVRLWARTRWTQLGHSPVPTYESMTQDASLPPRVRARAYSGLMEAGGSIARSEALALLRAREPALARVGLKHLVEIADAADVSQLFDAVRTRTAKEARLASAGLVRLRRHWVLDDLDGLWSADDPHLRRRAWWLQRSLGGWEQTLADVAIAADADPELARCGRNAAAPVYGLPTQQQQQRLRLLLARLNQPLKADLDIRLAAGLREVVPERGGRTPARGVEARPTSGLSRLRRWLRGR